MNAYRYYQKYIKSVIAECFIPKGGDKNARYYRKQAKSIIASCISFYMKYLLNKQKTYCHEREVNPGYIFGLKILENMLFHLVSKGAYSDMSVCILDFSALRYCRSNLEVFPFKTVLMASICFLII